VDILIFWKRNVGSAGWVWELFFYYLGRGGWRGRLFFLFHLFILRIGHSIDERGHIGMDRLICTLGSGAIWSSFMLVGLVGASVRASELDDDRMDLDTLGGYLGGVALDEATCCHSLLLSRDRIIIDTGIV